VTRLKLHLVDRQDFHKYYEAASGMFVPGAEPPNVGERVTVEVIFQGGPRVLLHGVVLWRRTTGDARARPGAGVGIDGAEQAKIRYLLGYVRGGLIDVRERRRLPVRLRVAYTGQKGRRVNFTRDLNEEGAFVRTAEMLELGASTMLLISPPGGDYRPVEVGRDFGTRVEVLSGLAAQEMVVNGLTGTVADGTRVRIAQSATK